MENHSSGIPQAIVGVPDAVLGSYFHNHGSSTEPSLQTVVARVRMRGRRLMAVEPVQSRRKPRRRECEPVLGRCDREFDIPLRKARGVAAEVIDAGA